MSEGCGVATHSSHFFELEKNLLAEVELSKTTHYE
jgi:hypothetical protein